jgi:hypothetical protein
MRAGQHLDRLGQLRVAGDAAVHVPVGAHKIREDLGVTGIGLRARGGMPVAVAADRFGVDGIHLITGRHQ